MVNQTDQLKSVFGNSLDSPKQPVEKPMGFLNTDLAAKIKDKTSNSQPIMSPKIQEDVATPVKPLEKEIENYVEKVSQTDDPIQAVLYAGMLTKGMEKEDGYQSVKLNLDENIEAHRSAITEFFKNAIGLNWDPRDHAWCAAFVDATLTKIGADRLGRGEERVRARDYINYGEEVSLDNIREGDIIILDFVNKETGKRDGKGDHVGFHTTRIGKPIADNRISMLGGNQSYNGARMIRGEGGAVSVKGFDKADVLSVRRITRDTKPWEGVKDQNPLYFYQSKETLGYGFNKGGLETGDVNLKAMQAGLEEFKSEAPERNIEQAKEIGKFAFESLPGISTAITAKDIEDELNREDPSYAKIALLGGSELIGLIPGLGTAAKVGLRAAAKKAGLNKVVDAIDAVPTDAPTPKPESEIIAAEKGLTPEEKVTTRKRPENSALPKIKSLTNAKDMKDAGKTNDEIFEATGLAYDPKTKLFRFEIDDTVANIKLSAKDVMQYKTTLLPMTAKNILLTDFLSHPELFARYPDLNNFNVKIKRGEDIPGGATAQFSPTTKTVIINADKVKSDDDLRNSLFHELQHGIQYQENFDTDMISGVTGSNNRYLAQSGQGNSKLDELRNNLKKSVDRHDELQSLKDVDGTPLMLKQMIAGNGSLIDEHNKLKTRIAYETRALSDYSYVLYRRNIGEVEAEVVGERALSDASRLADAKKTYMESLPELTEEQIKEHGPFPKNPPDSYFKGGKRDPFYKDLQKNVFLTSHYGKAATTKEIDIAIKKGSMSQKDIDSNLLYGKDLIRNLRSKKIAPTGTVSKQFAQGGVAMNNQMEMAFMNQGGLKDDGMKQDPVSGNPIPNGSMAEEVRDDIPAQLSEGEYVVPADVVRYYGVKHFEDIRNNAKQGLQSMEANGRIGGEPVPVGGPKAGMQQQMASDLNQDEMQEIQSMMMAVGGFVEQPNDIQKQSDPYQQQQTMYQQPMAMGANAGTFVPKPTITSGGFSFEPPQQAAPAIADAAKKAAEEAEIKAGETRCKAIGKVYNKETKLCEDDPKALEQSSDKDPTPTETPDPTAWMDSYNYNDPKLLSKQITAALTPGGGEGGFMPGVANFLKSRIAPPGSVLGMFSAGSVAAQSAANIMALEKIGGPTKELKELLTKFKLDNKLGPIEDFITGVDLFKDIENKNPNFVKASKRLKDLRVTRTESDKTSGNYFESLEAAKAAGAASRSSRSAKDIVSTGSSGTTTTAADTKIVKPYKTTAKVDKDTGKLDTSTATDADYTAQPGSYSGGRNTGGLATRRKTKGK